MTTTPTRPGQFGSYGGSYIPETLAPAVAALAAAYEQAKADPDFWEELNELHRTFTGRPTALTHAVRLTEHCGGAQIYLKREDLAHTGAHKINNALGQGLLAKRMGKTRIIAETGAGQHGVATAAVCAMLGVECIVYMGTKDIGRQKPNVFRMRLLGAEVRGVTSGSQTLKDAVNEAMRDWVTNPDSYYLLGSALGPHPYPTMVRDFQSVIGREAREQIQQAAGRLPDVVIACVGGGSNAIGIFSAFIPDAHVDLRGVEAGGRGKALGDHAARFSGGQLGVFQGTRSYVLQDEDGQISLTHSISAGLDYAGRDAVRERDLPIFVLQHVRACALEYTQLSAAEARRMIAKCLAAPAGLHTAQVDMRIWDEGAEDADRVRSTANTGDHHIGQSPGGLLDLLARLPANHALEVAHHRWVGVRAKRRAKQVVGVGVGDPVAHRFVDRVFERLAAGGHAAHLGAKQAHAEHIRLLAPDIFGAHVDDAFNTQHGAHRGGRDTMLARAGLGDDPGLAHTFGQQPLAERVVDFMRAGMRQVLALEVDLRAAAVLGQSYGVGQRGRPPGEGAVQFVQLFPEVWISLGLFVRRRQCRHRRRECLGDVAAAIGAELAWAGWCGRHKSSSHLKLKTAAPTTQRPSPRMHPLSLANPLKRADHWRLDQSMRFFLPSVGRTGVVRGFPRTARIPPAEE